MDPINALANLDQLIEVDGHYINPERYVAAWEGRGLPPQDMYEAAITLAIVRGWEIFPAEIVGKIKKSYKAAAHSNGKNWGMTKDPAEIGHDFRKWRPTAIGVPTGIVNGIFVVEADTVAGHGVDGIAALRALEADRGKLPDTLMAVSPSGSVHYYFRHPGGDIKVKCTTSAVATGVDVKGDGGMVIAPPSARADGSYRWLNDLPIADAPEWLIELVKEKPRVRHGNTQVDAITALSAITWIANDDLGWDEWNRVGMALWRATGGSDAGLKAFLEWSAKSAKHDEANARNKWEAYATCPPTDIGTGSLVFMADRDSPGWRDPDVAELNETYAVVLVGDKACILKTAGREVSFLNLSAFEEWHANRFVVKDNKTVPLAKYWRRHKQRRQYEGIEFAPGGGRSGYYNLWRGLAVEPRPGDCSRFLAHVRDNVCSGNDDWFKWVIGWFAQIVQQPDRKMGTSLVLRGKMGVGKTKVGEIFGSLLGDHYALVSDPRYVTGRFNSHMAQLLLLHADEAFWAGDRSAEGKLKDIVTGGHHFIELKGKEAVRVRNLIRLFVTGNPEWLVPAGFEERRFFILDVGDGNIQDHPYFAAIDDEMDSGGREALLHHLLSFDLSTVDLRAIQRTAALLEQQIATATPEQAWWLDTLNSGMLPDGPSNNANCSYKTLLFDDYVHHANQQGVRRKQIETKLGMFLKKCVGPNLVIERDINQQRSSSTMGATVTYRRWFYRFPPLQECRRRFAEMLRQEIPWEGAAEAEWTHPTTF